MLNRQIKISSGRKYVFEEKYNDFILKLIDNIDICPMNRKLKNEELGRISMEEYKTADKTGVVVLLDNVRSLHNVGSVFRTCDAFAIETLYLCGITGSPPNNEINKTALGATETVNWKHEKDIISLINSLKSQNFAIFSVEQAENAVFLRNFAPKTDKKYALIFGNEVNGVNQEAVDLSDGVIEINQGGTKHSLNVAVSAGVVLWEFFKTLGK